MQNVSEAISMAKGKNAGGKIIKRITEFPMTNSVTEITNAYGVACILGGAGYLVKKTNPISAISPGAMLADARTKHIVNPNYCDKPKGHRTKITRQFVNSNFLPTTLC